MLFFVVILLCILSGAEVDLFVPSFPEMQKHFDISPFMVELTLSVNFIAFCLSCLVVGNLGDKYGRKPIIMYSLFLFLLGSIFSTFAPYFWVVLVGRFLQGLGIAAPTVLSYLIIADNYSAKEQQKIMGVLNGTVALAMAFAPVVGSYVNLFYGWRGNFSVLLVMCIICIILTWFCIKEKFEKHDIKISFKEYLPVLKSKNAVLYILTIAFMAHAYWVFIGMSPILYMKDLGVSITDFGFYQGSMAALFGFLSVTSGYFFKKFGERNCFWFGIVMVALFIPLNLILLIFKIQSPIIITLVMLVMSAGVIFPMNLLYPLSLDSVPKAKGRIAAAMQAFRLMSTACALQIVSYLYDGTYFYISIVMTMSVLFALIACVKLVKLEKLFLVKE